MGPILATVLGAAALSVTAVVVVPQIVRLVRTGLTAGVSPSWTAIGAITTGAWTVYLGQRGLWWPATADLINCVSYAIAFGLLVRAGAHVGIAMTLAPAWLAVLVSAAALGGWAALGWVLSISYVVQVSPSVWTALRSTRVDGIAAGTWRLVLLEGLLWAPYAAIEGDAPLLSFALIAIAASTVILARVSWAAPQGTAS
jgi:hypothetical protein